MRPLTKSLYLSFSILLVLTLSSGVPLVYAIDNGTDLDLGNFDTALGDKLNISAFAGGLLASLMLSAMFLIPIAVYAKSVYPAIIVGLLTLGFATSVGWLDIWFLLVSCLFCGLMFAGKMRDLLTSSGGK